MALLTDEDYVISPSLPLYVLLKCFSCGLISIDQQANCNVDPEHLLQLLFVVLEIYQEIEQFWLDWRAANERFVRFIELYCTDILIQDYTAPC